MINGGSETISLPVFANFSQPTAKPPKGVHPGQADRTTVYLLCFIICQQNYQFVTDPVEHELSAQFDVVSSPLLHE